MIDIDQSPIGRTPRSNPATYTGLFAPLRELFAAVPEARARGYDGGRFSFNVKGGRCEACQGDGVLQAWKCTSLPTSMCPAMSAAASATTARRSRSRYRGKNIHEVLQMTVEDALRFFQAIPAVAGKLQTLVDVGLSYLHLGQNATTLSGGEAQRVKLARELAKRATGRTLYILDEPTTGLHFHDVAQLLEVLLRLRDAGNTVARDRAQSGRHQVRGLGHRPRARRRCRPAGSSSRPARPRSVARLAKNPIRVNILRPLLGLPSPRQRLVAL